MKQMSRRERVTAALGRHPVDRVPYAFWRHFPKVDRSPAGLAQATLRFHARVGDAPVVPTVFSPLSLARKLSGERLGHDLRERPADVKRALDAITETLIRFAEAALREGVSGIFYSIQAAGHRLHTVAEYEEFGEPYDHRVLASVRDRSSLTIVHGHGDDLMFEHLARLPAHAW